ncbi:thioredoxin-disulfide reductase [Alloscardovia criceti]|uniref:thioredoxin-disulfide reductase n=1 Tax=Alloscardovia criceti TaxID=356828 RepID=UPI00036CA3EE|nr:thioredoxin-disulfide reductase [Alloscardovia criceti]
MTVRNAIVIGSGPAGYTAALYLARAGYEPLVIAGAVTPGGQLVNTTEVENFPGFPEGIMGPDLMDNMREQAEKFGAEIEYDDVVSVDFSSDIKKVTTDMGETYEAKVVILATGASYRHLGIPGEEEFSGRGVSYCATCDGFFYKDKPIVVVGGGDSAMEEADFLARYGSSVTLIHRRDEFRASKVMLDRVKNNEKINILTNTRVTEINGAADTGVTSLSLENTVDGSTSTLDAQGLFIAIGHVPQSQFLGNAVELDAEGYIVPSGPGTQTSVPGVFAAGDAVDKVYRQAIVAAGAGCQAALDAQSYLMTLAD